MKLVTFNCNFNKGGPGMIQELVDGDADIVCVQRFDVTDIGSIKMTGRSHHFLTSFPGNTRLSRYGLLTMFKTGLSNGIDDIELTSKSAVDKSQGNSMVAVHVEGHRVINSLVGYPSGPDDKTGRSAWIAQTNQCLGEAGKGTGSSVLVGDFHYEDSDTIWADIKPSGMENVAYHLNTFTTELGETISLTKVFVTRDIKVSSVRHAINPFGHRMWGKPGMHWPVAIEYDL